MVSESVRRAALLLAFAIVVGGPWAVATAVAGETSAVAVSVSEGNCAVLSRGSVECWGSNLDGELGNGTTDLSPTPVFVSHLGAATAVSASRNDVCAVLSRGGVKCWGYARSFGGQLGNGTTAGSLTPVSVFGISNAVAVSAGEFHACAVLSDGSAECWGDGALGNETTTNSSIPVVVSGLSNAEAISVGAIQTCALLSTGGVECWGGGLFGATTRGQSTTPLAIPGIGNAVAVSAGLTHTCAVLSSGGVECWGSNESGELGNGTAGESPTPVPVSGIGNAVAVSAGWRYTCAVLARGSVECWGKNEDGQLGNGTTTDSPTPVPVSGIGNVVAVSAGEDHTCAVLSTGLVKCWGANAVGQLGDGTTRGSRTPVTVRLLDDLPAPVFGHTANLLPVSGSVSIRLPGTGKFVPIESAETVPLRTTVDTSHGAVRLTAAKRPGAHSSAAGSRRRTETGLFHGGAFRVTQRVARSKLRGGRSTGFTVLRLAGKPPSDCGRGAAGHRAAAEAARHHGGGDRLWGKAHGDFETGGQYATVTVRGTEWLTEETCAGTFVRVARGVVSVNDLPHHRTVLVKAPGSFLAHPGPGG